MGARHRPVSSLRTTEGGREVVRVWCECDALVLAAASDAAEAWRIARRVRDHHRGFAALTRGGEAA